MEIEGTEDIFQAAEDTPATSLNLHVMAVVDSQLFRKFLSRNQDDVRQTHNAIVLYFSMIFAMVRSELLKKNQHRTYISGCLFIISVLTFTKDTTIFLLLHCCSHGLYYFYLYTMSNIHSTWLLQL